MHQVQEDHGGAAHRIIKTTGGRGLCVKTRISGWQQHGARSTIFQSGANEWPGRRSSL